MTTRTGLLTVLGAIVAVCFSAYFTAVSIERDWWPEWGVWVLLGVVASSSVAWVLVFLNRAPGMRRPVMRISEVPGGGWAISNLTRRPLLEAKYMPTGEGGINKFEQYAALGMPDFPGRGKTMLHGVEAGDWVHFHWIRDDRRRTAQVRLPLGEPSVDVFQARERSR